MNDKKIQKLFRKLFDKAYYKDALDDFLKRGKVPFSSDKFVKTEKEYDKFKTWAVKEARKVFRNKKMAEHEIDWWTLSYYPKFKK